MGADDGEIRRVTRSRDEARATYNRMSRWYDVLAGSGEKRLIDAGLERLQLRAGERVLEIGCGTGYATCALARAVGEMGRVTGLDISDGMLGETSRRLIREGLAGRVGLELGDGARLPVRTGSMDAIWASFTLELFDTPQIPVVLGECRRVLRVGGRLGIAGMSRKGKSGLMLRLYEWAHDRLPRAVDCRPIFVEEAVRCAGFEVTESRLTSTWGLPVEIVLARA